MVRTQRYPVSYYELYPYSQNYPDDYYYPQENYPLYYPARTSKYEVYQAVLPYYYGERPVSRTGYGYYDNEPSDFQDEIQAAAREEREESQPIGQEMLYENDNTNDNLDDVNAAFLQNLIMSQMYKDSLDNQKDYYDPTAYTDYYPTDDSYGKWESAPVEPSYRQEDEDVRELKQLARAKDNRQGAENIHWFQNRKYKNQGSENYEAKRASLEIKSLKKEATSTTSTTVAPKTTDQPKTNGQKEEVLARPATPVRHPFSAPVLDMMSKSEEDRKRTPSVYDTIKHMLDMEKNLENVSAFDS